MNPGPSNELDLTVFGIAVLLFAVAAIGFWWLRNRGVVTGQGPIRLVALRPLGQKRVLALVEVEDERFLLGMTDAQISCLGRLPSSASSGVPEAKGAAA